MTKVFGIDLVSVASCAQVSALADGAVSAAVEFMARAIGAEPTFEVYNKLRIEWRTAYLEQRGLDATSSKTAGALDVAWLRNVLEPLKAEYDFEVPKSATKAATDKAAARKAKADTVPEAVKAAQNVAQLDAINADSPELKLAIAEKKAALIKADVAAEKQAKAKAEKEKLEGFVAFFKALSPVERDTFYALRDKRFGVVCAVIPEVELQASLDMQRAITAGAKAEAKKPRKAKQAA